MPPKLSQGTRGNSYRAQKQAETQTRRVRYRQHVTEGDSNFQQKAVLANAAYQLLLSQSITEIQIGQPANFRRFPCCRSCAIKPYERLRESPSPTGVSIILVFPDKTGCVSLHRVRLQNHLGGFGERSAATRKSSGEVSKFR